MNAWSVGRSLKSYPGLGHLVDRLVTLFVSLISFATVTCWTLVALKGIVRIRMLDSLALLVARGLYSYPRTDHA